MLKIYDFWAEWCGPCRAMIPVITKLAEQYNVPDSGVEIIKVNIDTNPELTQRFDIKSIPTLIFEKNGEVVETVKGLTSRPALENLITEHK